MDTILFGGVGAALAAVLVGLVALVRRWRERAGGDVAIEPTPAPEPGAPSEISRNTEAMRALRDAVGDVRTRLGEFELDLKALEGDFDEGAAARRKIEDSHETRIRQLEGTVAKIMLSPSVVLQRQPGVTAVNAAHTAAHTRSATAPGY